MYENPLGNETRLKSVLEWRSLLKQTNKQDKTRVKFWYLLQTIVEPKSMYSRKRYETKLDVHKGQKVYNVHTSNLTFYTTL